MRAKRRYIAFQIIGEKQFKREEVIRHLVRSHLNFVGEKAYSIASPWLISFEEETQKGLVRTKLDGLNQFRSSMALITSIEGHDAIFRTLGVCGTIRGCEDRFIKKMKISAIERVEKRNKEEDPGRLKRIARIKAMVPGSKIKISHKEFTLRQAFQDGRIDLTSDEGSFGFTVLDLLGSNLGNEGRN